MADKTYGELYPGGAGWTRGQPGETGARGVGGPYLPAGGYWEDKGPAPEWEHLANKEQSKEPKKGK